MAHRAVPDVVVRRLTQYYRALLSCRDRGLEVVSSQVLGEMLNVTAAQIRKDLSYFGGFGKQGIGYNVANLLEHLQRILGLTQSWPMALIGVGNLGQALLRYRGFVNEGFEIVAIFDSDPQKVGRVFAGLTVHADQEMARLIPDLGIKIALLSIPSEKAQEAADMLIQAGVQAILNYAPVTLRVPENVWVRQMDPLAALESMTFYLAAEIA